MQNSEFEKNVQQKMEELKLTPADAVWQKVEAELPQEKKSRRWMIWFLLFAVLTAGSFYFFQHKIKKNSIIAGKSSSINNDRLAGFIKENNNKYNPKKTNEDTILLSKENKKEKNYNKDDGQKFTSGYLNINNGRQVKLTPLNKLIGATIKNNLSFITKNKTTVSIKAPAAHNNSEEKIVSETILQKSIPPGLNTTLKDTLVVANAVVITVKLATTIDTPGIIKIDSIGLKSAINNRASKKNKPVWQFGLHTSIGFSNVRNNLFSKNSVYNNPSSNFSSGPPVPQGITPPSTPVAGAALNIGWYAQKNIGGKWHFTTGIQYAFYANTLKVGTRVDSAVNFNFDANKMAAADFYYRAGNTSRYKNKFHFIEVPLLFKFQLSKKIPVFIESGPSVVYLIHTNALAYNSRSAAYFTSKDIFNKLSLALNAGIEFQLAKKTKFPFGLGYRFNYGIGAVTKKDYGKQHLVNSMVVLKIPFKR